MQHRRRTTSEGHHLLRLGLGGTPAGRRAASTRDGGGPRGWTVGDVLEAAGYYPHNSFGLSPVAFETNAASSSIADRVITGVFNLFGVDSRGAVRADATQAILWEEFLRAVDDGLYEGDPSRLIVYDYGSAGGLTPDGLWEVVQFLFENRDLGAQAMAQLAALGVLGHQVGDSRLVGGRPPRAVCRRRVL